MLCVPWQSAHKPPGGMVKNLCITVFLVLLIPGCSYFTGKKQVVESDFIEPLTPEQVENVEQEIEHLRRETARDPDNAAIHRRLAVYYRIVGTPRSRLLSLEEIEKAIELEPDNPINYVERGLTMLSRSFLGEAEKSFRTALGIDKDCFHCWYHLGRIKKEEYLKTMCFPEDLKAALHCFHKAYKLRPRHNDTLFNLAFLHLFRNMYRTARNYAEEALEYYPDDPRFHHLLGTINLQQGKFEEVEREFSKALELTEDEDRTVYEDVSVLLPPLERELYETYPDAEKIESNRRFWIENDPTPTTDRNERRLEHLSRVFLAQELLTNERLDLEGSETHRGKALISYGLPHKKYYDLRGGIEGPMLVWKYKYGPDSFYVYFQDEFLSGNYQFPIENYYYGELSASTMEAIPQCYDFPIKCKEFTASYGIAQIRGMEEKTHVEISVAIPDSLLTRRLDTWDLHLALFDYNLNRMYKDKRVFKPDTLRRIQKTGGTYSLYAFDITLPPYSLESTLAMELIQQSWQQRSVIKHPFTIRDFSGKHLKVSTVNLTIPGHDGSCSGIPDPHTVYSRNEMLCIAYEIYNLSLVNNRARYRLTYTIKKTEVEKTGIGKTLSYITASMRGKRPDEAPYIESSIEQSANDSTVRDRLQIDIGALEPLLYTLVLEISDLNSGTVVSEKCEFTVTE
jgi:GWxTD domain-containing protein